MNIEVERKAWIRDPAGLEKRVRKIARLVKVEKKLDFYYAPAGARDPVADCFRIRMEGDNALVTFKEKEIVRRSEVNQESEIAIKDPMLLARLLEEAGFRMFICKEKHSRIFRSRQSPGLTIELNRLAGLGSFVEVEVLCARKREAPGAIRRIDRVFQELDIDPEDIETRLYIEIMREKFKGREYRFRARARSLERAYKIVSS